MRARERRRHHVVAAPLEQRIVQQLAQPGERMAHRRLRQVQAFAGRRDAAVAVDRVENREQVQVDPGKLHWRAPCRTLGAQCMPSECMQGVDPASCSRCIGVRRAAQRTLRVITGIPPRQEAVMDFEYSPRVRSLQARLLAFFDEHIYPNEARYAAEIDENRRAGNAFKPLRLIEELKPRARDAQLWNLFLPRSPRAPEGLSNLEYAPLCEIMGRVPWAPEVFNCAAPDTGNMETIERYGTEAQKDAGWSRCSPADPLGVPDDRAGGRILGCHEHLVQHPRDGNDYVINGRKWWSSGANDPRCKLFIVMGKTNPEADRHQQQSMILVPSDTPGVKVLRHLPVFGYDDAPHGHAEVAARERARAGEQPAARRRPRLRDRAGPARAGTHPSLHALDRRRRARARAHVQAAHDRASRSASRSPRSRSGTSASPSRAAMIDQARLMVLNAAYMMDTVGNKVARKEIAMIKVDRAEHDAEGDRLGDPGARRRRRDVGFPARATVGGPAHAAHRRRPGRGASQRHREAGAGEVSGQVG